MAVEVEMQVTRNFGGGFGGKDTVIYGFFSLNNNLLGSFWGYVYDDGGNACVILLQIRLLGNKEHGSVYKYVTNFCIVSTTEWY